MNKLQTLLKNYNREHFNDTLIASWEKMYCEDIFPKYWTLLYSILHNMEKTNSVIEIGCGLGNVTSILCQLGFQKIKSFERNVEIALAARRKIKELFKRTDVIEIAEFPCKNCLHADILILVNCVYADDLKNKREYIDFLYNCYVYADYPNFFLLEVVDNSYIKEDKEFPNFLRLGFEDIKNIFPKHKITFWETYKYPINRRSKTLYLIEKQEVIDEHFDCDS